jgi:membrane-bound lytic murein transglycosylase A
MIGFDRVKNKASKNFFFVNKKEAKKTSLIWTVLVKPPVAQLSKSFLVTFFQKSNCFFLVLAATLAGCVPPPQPIIQTAGAPAITAVPLATLPGWASDDTADALAAFVRSCKAISVLPADQGLGGIGLAKQTGGQAGLWSSSCATALTIAPADDDAAKAFFINHFDAYELTDPALITGYFDPEYPGSKNLAPGYSVPLYAKPADPYLAELPRAAIDGGALTRKAPVTAYVTNAVDAFMLQIIGSGRILLPNGQILRVGFDGQNHQPYTPIGRLMVEAGDLAPDNVSFQTISAWLKANPGQAQPLMEQNQRYVFLRPLGPLPDNLGAPGTLGVPLTAGRSLAVDNTDIPLGTPIFLTTSNPLTGQPLDRLVVAQDTGGGIHGAAAADLFFGAGAQSEATAGRMHQQGQLYLLLPRPVPAS